MVLQQTEARSAEHHGVGLLRAMIKRPRWLVGYGLGVVAVGLQAGALAIGALLVVQPVGVTVLLFALPLAARYAGQRLTRRQWAAAVVLTVALAAFVVVGRPIPGDPVQPLPSWLVVAVPLATVVVAACVAGRRLQGPQRALALAIGTGIMFGIQAALSKSVLSIGTSGGLDLPAVSVSWETYAWLVMALASVALQQLAFQAGDLSASQPAITVLTPLSAAICAAGIFGETLQATTLGWVVAALAVLAMTWATLALSGAATDPSSTPPRSHFVRLAPTSRGGDSERRRTQRATSRG
jgi:drug/metabolite transporter (DMT)-like permease